MPDQIRLRPDPNVVGRELGDEMVLVHLRTNQIYELNHTGARLWTLLSNGISQSEIESRLLNEFEGDEAQMIAEIDALLSNLIEEALVVRT